MKLETGFILLCALILACSSCAKRKADTSNSRGKAETSAAKAAVDTSDPNAVADAAWQAIVEEDYEAYTALVHPDSRQRETREQWSDSVKKMKEAPGFPTKPKLKITPVEDSNRAAAVTEDFRVSMGMVFKDGRWWMD